jgi:TRAP-type C4-dicarboxylate transport system substrate-binding protein
MKGEKTIKVSLVAGLTVILIMITLTAAWTQGTGMSKQKPIELKAITAWPTHVPQNYWYHEFIKVVNEKALKEGVPVKVKGLGGPEVVGTREQFAAMRSGIVDMVYTCGDYFTGETLELSAISCIRADPMYFLKTLRETKVMDVVNEASREKSGCVALFPTLMGRGFTLLSTKPINPGDWSGLKIRSIGGITAVGIPAMNGSSVLISPAEVFEALQRGAVDGVIGAASDRYGFGERGVYKYILMPRFFFSATYWFISAKAWDGLPENIKGFLREVSNNLEAAGFPWCRKWDDETIGKYVKEDGVKLVQCSPEEERKVAKAFRENYLDFIANKSAKYGPRVKKLIKDHVY